MKNCKYPWSVVLWLSLVCLTSSAGRWQPHCSAAETDDKTAEAATQKEQLTLEGLFAKGEFESAAPPNMIWSRRSSTYFKWDKTSDGKMDLVRYDPASGPQAVVVPGRMLIPSGMSEPLKVQAFEFSSDESRLLIYTNSQRVWRRPTRGDYWILDLPHGDLHQLGGNADPASLMFAKFSADGSRVAYVRANDLYVENVSTREITRITHDGSPSLINGTADWVNEEELDLRDCYRWSPDGRSLLFWQFDSSDVARFHLINNTDSSEPRIVSFAYPKVGQKNSATRLGVVSAAGGSVRWIDLPGDPREHYIPHAEWTPDGKHILVQQFNRLQTEQKIFIADPMTGKVRHVMTETDEAWLENENPVRWLEQGKSFLWISSRSGWRHAYRVPLDLESPKPLAPIPITQGKFDVMEIEAIVESEGWLYYAASPDNATQRYVYRCKLDGSGNERLSMSSAKGWFKLDLSPDGKWGIESFSNFTTPPVVKLLRMADRSVVETLVSNRQLNERLQLLRKPHIEFFKVDIGSGISLDGWSIRPADATDAATGAGKTTKRPLIMHVYGEPHGQTVRDAWPGSRGLWHWYLAQQGYVVASVDNRGTNVPRGREWRKVVNRKIGIIAPQEQAQALDQLLDRWSFVDRERVGIWGWSGGGSMSLNAIFRYPDKYRAAISIAPVADQRLYDTIYQERYMGLPGDNEQGYIDGSPITHAQNLRGHLLIIHGTGDDNCHYQGTERLMNELVARNKLFSVLPYPNRTHAIREGKNTELHMWTTMTAFFEKSLRE